ncbi:MAG: hypothetical protein HYR60_02285 [Acidobacteria bacterium]|nr:hypothetical protein [Acidobacteriota bacterium]
MTGMFGANFFPELLNAVVPLFAGNRIRPHLTVALLNGEVALAGVSGKPFADHALRLKRHSRAAKTLVFGLLQRSPHVFPGYRSG